MLLIGSQTYARPWVRYEIMKSFRKGNAMLGVHINSIGGKDRRTKPAGPKPLAYLGVSFSATGDSGTLYEKNGNEWQEYGEIDGSASYRTGGVGEQYRGKGFSFSNWYPTYDWVANDGYENFVQWVS